MTTEYEKDLATTVAAAPPSHLRSQDNRTTNAKLALIQAGIEFFGTHSLAGASTRQIAKQAGQNVASIAYHFGGKKELYLAVAEHVAWILRREMQAQITEIRRFLDGKNRPRKQCLSHLTRILCEAVRLKGEIVALSQYVVREQTHPTEAFQIIYEKALEPLHCIGSSLIAVYLGEDENSVECIVRFHALLGASLGFRVARETLIHRTGWDDFNEERRQLIEQVVTEHTELVLTGLLRVRRRQAAQHAAKKLNTTPVPTKHPPL